MKVLEKWESWNVQERCTGKGNGYGGCNSLLKVEEQDLFITVSSCYDGSCDKYITFECPVCKKYTDLDASKVPYQISKNLKRKNI